MPLANNLDGKVSEDDYLKDELISETKHEYVDGLVYAMVGASKKHNIISVNILSELRNELKQRDSSCNTFSSDMKVKVNDLSKSYYYPDIMVVCNDDKKNESKEDEYYQDNPLIIVEVLSKSTEKYDKSAKRLAYFNIPTLKEYVLVEQNKCEVVVFEKVKNWQSSYYFLGDEITFESIKVTLSVENIYYQVNNEEMLAYAESKEQENIQQEDDV